MSLWRGISRGARALIDPKAADRDIADEVENYLEQATESWIERGLSPEAARRAAKLEVGTAAAVQSNRFANPAGDALDTLFADLRYAIRRLRRTPSFTAASVLTIALGIGAATAIFSAVDGVLLKPLPYPDSDRLVASRIQRLESESKS